MNEVGTVYTITRYIIHPTIGKIKTKRKRKRQVCVSTYNDLVVYKFFRYILSRICVTWYPLTFSDENFWKLIRNWTNLFWILNCFFRSFFWLVVLLLLVVAAELLLLLLLILLDILVTTDDGDDDEEGGSGDENEAVVVEEDLLEVDDDESNKIQS